MQHLQLQLTADQEINNGRQQNEKAAHQLCRVHLFLENSSHDLESKRERFFSVYTELKKTVEERAIQAGEGKRNWTRVRISEPGRHFWGFARR